MKSKVFSFQFSAFSSRSALRVSAPPRESTLHPSSFIPHPFSARSAFRLPLSAFSLIELLVVIAIIMILASLMVPAMKNISGGTNLTGAAEEMSAVVNLARQRAGTFNRQVAIRFWKDGDNYRSYQIWEQKDSAFTNSWAAIERERKLPQGIVITNNIEYSSLLTRNPGTTNSRDYADALVTPAGALVAASDKTAVTLVPEFGPQGGGVISGLPPNFATIVIEPINAIPKIYRPQ